MVEAKCDKKDYTMRGGTFRRILFVEIPTLSYCSLKLNYQVFWLYLFALGLHAANSSASLLQVASR